MMLIDTSVFVPIFRDASGDRRRRFRKFLKGRTFVLARFTQIELLRGCSSDAQWEQLNDYLDVQDYVEAQPESWAAAARIHFDLKRKGITVSSIYDCCIAQIVIENRLTLVHHDNDFEAISKVRPMQLTRFDAQARS